MPLEIPAPSKADKSKQVAIQILQTINQTAQRVYNIRTQGIPAAPAQPERVGPNGQIIPARPAEEALLPADIDAWISPENKEKLDAIAEILGLSTPSV